MSANGDYEIVLSFDLQVPHLPTYKGDPNFFQVHIPSSYERDPYERNLDPKIFQILHLLHPKTRSGAFRVHVKFRKIPHLSFLCYGRDP
jgi:hypothetical protein